MKSSLKDFGKKAEADFKNFGKKAEIGLKDFGKKTKEKFDNLGKKIKTDIKHQNDKLLNDPNDKLLNDPNDKLLNDPNDKLLNDKLLNDKPLNDKLLNDKLLNDKSPNNQNINKKMKKDFDNFNQKILITFHADNYKVSKKKFLLWFFLMALLLLLIIIAVVVVVSVLYTNGTNGSGGSGNVAAVANNCPNPISIYKNGICKTNCTYGATDNKQKCNKCPNPISVYKTDKCQTTCKYGATDNKQKCNQPPDGVQDCPNQKSIYKNNECKLCTYGIAKNGTTCNKLCGLYQTGTDENKICNPNVDGTNCVTNTKILHNNEEGICTYNNGCMYKSNSPNGVITKYRITADKSYCDEVCINYVKDGSVYFNTDYKKSDKLFTWTQYGECVQKCTYGPALVPNTKPATNDGSLMPAYKNSAITDPKCNTECNYPAETNTVINGSGRCANVTAVCGDKAKYNYNINSDQNYTRQLTALEMKKGFTRKGLATTVTNNQTFIHGCNNVCTNPYISANTARSGKCVTNCADNTNIYFASVGGYRCNCPNANGQYLGTYLDNNNNMRYCDSECKNYDLSENNDTGKCVCKYPDAYSKVGKTCVLKPCVNTAHKIMAHDYNTGYHGTCKTVKTCPSCVNNNGTDCNDTSPNYPNTICQSWSDSGQCIWTRNPIDKGYDINAAGCGGSLQSGVGTNHARIVKYVKDVETYHTYPDGNNIRFGANYKIAHPASATNAIAYNCFGTYINCNNCNPETTPRPQCAALPN